MIPHTDFLQVVFTAEAREHATPDDTAGWIDPAGWEQRSSLVDPAAAAELGISAAERHFLQAALERT